MASYYHPEHLAKFADIGRATRSWPTKFFDWYARGVPEGALSEREKALIALAVAHAVQCPYCIDAYSQDVPREGRRPRADDRGGPRGRGDPRRRLAGPRRADARARQASRDVDAIRPRPVVESPPSGLADDSLEGGQRRAQLARARFAAGLHGRAARGF